MAGDFRTKQLQLFLKRSRTAMLWAIANKDEKKAGAYAEKAARFSRLLEQRQVKFGGVPSSPPFGTDG
jgi:hypothetical protein